MFKWVRWFNKLAFWKRTATNTIETVPQKITTWDEMVAIASTQKNDPNEKPPRIWHYLVSQKDYKNIFANLGVCIDGFDLNLFILKDHEFISFGNITYKLIGVFGGGLAFIAAIGNNGLMELLVGLEPSLFPSQNLIRYPHSFRRHHPSVYVQ